MDSQTHIQISPGVEHNIKQGLKVVTAYLSLPIVS